MIILTTAITIPQAIVSIILAIIASAGTAFGFVQFLIKRKDEKEENDVQKKIDKAVKEGIEKSIKECGTIGDRAIEIAIDKVKEELHQEIEEGLNMRGEEGKERFEINSEQIKHNMNMIQEVINMQKKSDEKFDKLAESLTTLNEAMTINSRVTKACAEGARSTIYDRILLVANTALKRSAITISEKTNLKQLYNSWTELQGEDPKITTYYEDCMKLISIPDEEGNLGGV